MRRWLDQRLARGRGFTIVELLIVIAVVGVLATIVVIAYGAVINNTRDAALKTDLGKIADIIKLEALDNDGIPTGGATSSLAGDSTVLSGVQVAPSADSYDLTMNNLFYCAGSLEGNDEFAIVAMSVTGKVFAYVSNQGMTELDPIPSPWDHAGICTSAGFEAPYTWSYGYNPDPEYQWFSWAYDGEYITNLATNPSFETNLTGHIGSRGVVTLDATRGFSGTSSARYVADGTAGGNYMNSTVTTGDIGGEEITASIRVQRSTTEANMFLRIYFRDVSNAFIAPLGGVNGETVAVSDSDWTEASVIAVAPAGTMSVQIYSLFSGVQPNGATFWFDGVMVGLGSVTKFYDGTSFEWTWNGAAHASTSTGPPR